MHRRDILTAIGATALSGSAFAAAPALNPALPPGVLDTATLERLPDKQPLIKLTYRPPNYETPLDAFRSPITANDRFFVRYHLANIPDMDRLRKDFTLKIGGDAAGKSLTLTMEDLHRLPTTEVTAVCQCAGNRRGFSNPHVPGVQWGSGAMGNAIWSGVRLRDVLAKAGVKPGALEIGLAGADGPVLETTPAFRKSLPLEKAMDDNVIIAFAMNHQPLPHYNGYPIRLIVPGWTATYWMKHLTQLDIRSKPLDSFWMQKSYRVPRGLFAVDQPFASQEAPETSAITEIVVNSLITNLADGTKLPAGGSIIQGIAWDRGHGIKSAEVSLDGGANWRNATLGGDLGRYAFRQFSLDTGKLSPGKLTILARATSSAGEMQTEQLRFNPAGYQNNVPMPVSVTVT